MRSTWGTSLGRRRGKGGREHKRAEKTEAQILEGEEEEGREGAWHRQKGTRERKGGEQ